MKYLIKNAILWTPDGFSAGKMDLLIENGRISAVGDELQAALETCILDVSGGYVSAGWIDAHAHMYLQGKNVKNEFLPHFGVTYVVDAGTAGPGNFPDFKRSVIDRSEIPLKSLLNIGRWGVDGIHEELQRIELIDEAAVIDTYNEYRSVLLGLKARVDSRVCFDQKIVMQKLRELGDALETRIVVHPSRTTLAQQDILSYLQEGDIYAHTYSDKTPGLLDENGRVKKAAIMARERGVIFDLSHGNGNFSFDIARAAMAQGFGVDMISTDLHKGSYNIVKSLPLVMTKMLHLGESLNDILKKVTIAPARIMGIEGRKYYLKPGDPADLTAFVVDEGDFELTDSCGKTETAHRMIRSLFTIVEDKLYEPIA